MMVLNLKKFKENYKARRTTVQQGKVVLDDGDFVVIEAILTLAELLSTVARKP